MLEEALAMNKKLVERLEGQDREKTVANLFKEKGIDPKAAALMGADADPEKWIADYGDLFAGSGKKLDEPPAETGGQQAAPPAVSEDVDHDLQAEREAYEAAVAAQGHGAPSKITLNDIDKINSFENEADLMKFINSGGREG